MGQSGTYFNAEGKLINRKKGRVKANVRPEIPASKQNAGVFADASILWNWTAFQVPKGSSKLISVTAIIRGKNGVAEGAVPIDLFFARSINGVAPANLGTQRAAVTTFNWANHLIGYHPILAADYTDADLVALRVAQSGLGTGSRELVLTGEPDSGTNVGYDTIYVAGIAKGEFDWTASAVLVATAADADDIEAGSTEDLVVKTGSAVTNFAIGDVLNDEDDLEFGEIETIDSATEINFLEETVGTGTSDIHTVDKKVYNIHPITLILGFEQ